MKKVPNLRFKEFSGEWEEKQLGKIVKFTNGKAHENCIDEQGEYIVVNSKFISSNGKVIKKSRENLCSLNMGDIAFVMSDVPNGRALAKCYFIEQNSKYTLNQRICALTPMSIESKFLFYILNRHKYFLKFDNGVGQTNLRKDDVLNCSLTIPSLKEQEKIAAFFSLIDKKIELQTEKVEELKNYKKGLMQKIFSQELRFKGFSGEWESHPLSKLGTFFKGAGLSKADLSDEGNPCVLYGELYTKYTEVIGNVKSKTNVELDNAVIGKTNDVLIPSSGETAIDIATASCLQQDDVILGGDLNVFRSNQVNGIFTSYQLNTSKKFEIAKLAQGASVVHVYNDQLKRLKLSIPTIQEQEKIASFFSLIDKKLELEMEKLEKLQDYKKGLLQQMFI